MFARLLLLAAELAPGFAQDQDVIQYIEELRAPKPPRDVQAEQRELLAALTRRLDESTDPNQRARVYLRISGVEQFLGQADAAMAAARNAHDLAPEDDRISVGLAGVLVKNGETAEVPSLLGVESIRRRGAPSQGSTVSDKSVAAYCAELAHELLPYDAQDVSRRADTAVSQAVAPSPQVATYHCDLALAFMESGHRDQARAELRLALASNPPDQERDAILAALARLGAPHQ